MMMQGGGGGGQYREESRGYLERGTSSGSGSSSAYPGASASGYGASSAGYGGSSAGYGSQPAAAAAGAGSSGYGSYAGGQAGYSQNGYGSQPAGGSYAAPAASREAPAAAGGAGGYDAWAEYAKQQQGAAAAAPVPPSYDQVRKSLCAAVLRRYKAHGHLVFHSCRPAATAPRRRPGTPATATATPVSSFAFAVRCGPRTFVASACSVLLLLRQCRFCLPCSRFTGLPRARPCPASLWPLTLSARGATQTASADRRRIAPTHGGSTLTAAHKQSPPAGVEVDAHTLPRAFSGETRTKSAPLRGRPSRGR